MQALTHILDRDYGRPTQTVAGDPTGAPVQLAIISGVPRPDRGESEMSDAE